MVAIVNYGVGNLASIQNMLKKIGAPSRITSLKSEIQEAKKIILPGVGAFDTCASKLMESGLLPVLQEKVLIEKTPVLGVCVGMQLLVDGSEEGQLAGLGWIKGKTVKFEKSLMGDHLKVPHMGWTDIQTKKTSRLFTGMEEASRFYFVHSYYVQPNDPEDVLATAQYGSDFTCAVEHENIIGVQFHPEKSHKFGMKLLHNFVKNC